jgi:dephospho-CoA kinase
LLKKPSSLLPPTKTRPLSRPVAVAITGGIGAGKSTALLAFRAHGAATVSSDEIVHHLLRTDAGVRAALVERFGESILGDDGLPDRARIAAIVFEDAEALAFLEALLHPLVSREYLQWRGQLGTLDEPPDVCVTEVPLLFESGGETRFDRVVVITAPRQLREQRRHAPQDNREARLLDDRVKVAKADFHYVNTGTVEDLDAWVAGVMAELTNDNS